MLKFKRRWMISTQRLKSSLDLVCNFTWYLANLCWSVIICSQEVAVTLSLYHRVHGYSSANQRFYLSWPMIISSWNSVSAICDIPLLKLFNFTNKASLFGKKKGQSSGQPKNIIQSGIIDIPTSAFASHSTINKSIFFEVDCKYSVKSS